MGKVSNLIKTLLPIGVVIGGLYFLSQSKRVNIFKTTVPPDITVNPLKLIPTFINEPQFIPVPFQETPESLTRRFGQLFTKTGTQRIVSDATLREAERIADFQRGNLGKQLPANFFIQYADKYGLDVKYTNEPIYVPLFTLE